MKTRNLLAATLAATLTLAGCSKNDDPGNDTRSEVNITTTIGGSANGGTDEGEAPGSRATVGNDGSGSFDATDVLGLYATTGGATKLDNKEYTVATKLYWDDLSTTAPVTFSAYYPRTATIADPAAYTFNAATATDKDLLLATPVTKSKGEAVTLNFRHAMHRLIINLSTTVDGLNIADAIIELTGMNAAATVNITTGAVTVGETAEADGTYTAVKKSGATTEYILAPQKVTTDADWILITIAGKQYTYKIPAQIKNTSGTMTAFAALESGKTLTLNLAITRDGITLTTGDIAAWDTQGKIDGEIDFGSGTLVASTIAALNAAIATATGTADNPTVIKLGDNIDMGDNDFITIGAPAAPKYIKVSGNGKTITKGSKDRIFNVIAASSLTLTNVILDGNNAATGDFLVTTLGGSTLILDDGAVLQNLKNWETFASTGVALSTASTLVMNSGASIKGVEGDAISSADNSLNQIRLNGGSLSGSQTDLFVSVLNSNSAVIHIAAMPALGSDRKMIVSLGYHSGTCPTIAPEGGSSPALSLDNFAFTVRDYTTSGDITAQCDIFLDTDGIIKVKKQP